MVEWKWMGSANLSVNQNNKVGIDWRLNQAFCSINDAAYRIYWRTLFVINKLYNTHIFAQ